MALELDLQTTPIGVAMLDAYARITRFHGDKHRVHYEVEVHASADARNSGAKPIQRHKFIATDLTGDILPALYAHLKAQPGFETAVDC